jgi:hypothetical protein
MLETPPEYGSTQYKMGMQINNNPASHKKTYSSSKYPGGEGLCRVKLIGKRSDFN